jgi:hypothetical protein
MQAGQARGVLPPKRYRNHYEAYRSLFAKDMYVLVKADLFYRTLCYHDNGIITDRWLRSMMQLPSNQGKTMEEVREICKAELVEDMRKLKMDRNLYDELKDRSNMASVLTSIQALRM